jgi:5-methyltetrahydrofolate--homocysteine methyltransferase
MSLSGFGLSAIGGNCGTGPEELLPVIRSLHAAAPGLPLAFKPNAGVPSLVGGKTVYSATPESMARSAVAAVEAGARIVGGCCGSTPAHIKAIRRAVDGGMAASL